MYVFHGSPAPLLILMSSEAPPAVAQAINEEFSEELNYLTSEDLNTRSRLLENDVRIMKSEIIRLQHEQSSMMEQLQDNMEKIKLNKQLPYLVANIVELLEVEEEENDSEDDEEAEGAFSSSKNKNLDNAMDIDATASNFDDSTLKKANKKKMMKCAVVKTTTRTTSFLPLIGLVDSETLKPGDLVGVNKDSFLVLDTLPSEYDSRVKAMEVDERPTEDYGDVGGLDKQIEELVEAVVLPMTQADRFKKLGIKPPKGVIMYGPPGTGKTLLARACAAQTKSTFLKLAGPQLVQVS
jgi:26S proteasome regulatory subunit T5